MLAAAALAGLAWLLSPVVAFHAFREAARAGDRDGLAEVIDYPALRASLGPQLAAEQAAEVAVRPVEPGAVALGRRVLERLGRGAETQVLAPLRLSDRVESRLEPTALAAVAEGRIVALDYVTPSRVHVRVGAAEGALFVLQRTRPFDWDVVHVALPGRSAGLE